MLPVSRTDAGEGATACVQTRQCEANINTANIDMSFVSPKRSLCCSLYLPESQVLRVHIVHNRLHAVRKVILPRVTSTIEEEREREREREREGARGAQQKEQRDEDNKSEGQQSTG